MVADDIATSHWPPLPPAGPALILHQAADLLRRRANAAQARMAEDGPTDAATWHAELTNMLGGEVGDLAGLMSPHLVLDMADWLDSTAAEAVRHAAQGCGNDQAEITDGHPMTMALRVLATEGK